MEVEAGIDSSFWKDGISNFIKSPDPITVHDHLFETKIYATIGENECIHTRPSSIHFKGFQIGKKYSQKLRIINASNESQRMHIIPPSSEDFQIQYQKNEMLVPGMYLEVNVIFNPKSHEYKHDAIRIHSQSSSNLIVPIHAYLKIDIGSSFPSKINFKPTVVGHSSQKIFPITNPTEMDFDFQIQCLEKHNAFSIEPSSGVIPANGQMLINVVFTPLEYCTTCAKIQILVSQFNAQPFYCTLMGSSEPGLASKLTQRRILNDIPEKVLDPRTISPLGRTRAKKKTTILSETNSQKTLQKETKDVIVKDGIHFPKNLSNAAAVNYVLTQKPNQMKAKDLRAAIQSEDTESINKMSQTIEKNNSTCNNKQMKEAVFQHLVGKNIAEEEKNQLRWCVRVGEHEVDENVRDKVIHARSIAQNDFKVFQRVGDTTIESNRASTEILTNQRTVRPANQHVEGTPTFDLYLNNEWEHRHRVLTRFIQATRKVVIRKRAGKNINHLTNHLELWRRGNFMSSCQKPRHEKNKELEIVENLNVEFDESRIKSFSFPEYQDPDKKDDMAVDALGPLQVNTTHIDIKERVETYKLNVPQQYKSLSYNKHKFTTSVHSYIPKAMARKLRVGAESETIQADYQTTNDESFDPTISSNDVIMDSGTVKLTVPTKFLEPSQYHPMHIFNPLPGVQAHAQKMLYSEVDDDYKLCPLVPRMGPVSPSTDEVVPGIMAWKKFPSQSLVTMTPPTLANVFLPRWSDPFDGELSSSFTPSLLTSLPDDDVITIDDVNESGEEEDRIIPTMNMIREEFQTKDILSSYKTTFDTSTFLKENLTSNNNIAQSNMELRGFVQTSLNEFVHSKHNTLGKKIQSRVESLQSDWTIQK